MYTVLRSNRCGPIFVFINHTDLSFDEHQLNRVTKTCTKKNCVKPRTELGEKLKKCAIFIFLFILQILK